jgi:hypothetical protein
LVLILGTYLENIFRHSDECAIENIFRHSDELAIAQSSHAQSFLEEVDKVTGIEAKRYPTEIYNTFTPAQKAKHWQLLHPGQTPGTGPAKGARGAAPAPGMTSQIA